MITIPSHPEADSYLTLAEANALMESRLQGYDEWEALEDEKKERLLKIASSHIDSLRFFHELHYPRPADYRDKQALKFPRTNSRRFTGKVNSVSTNYFIDTNLIDRTDMPDNFWKYGAVVITDGAGKGKTYAVTAFEMSTGKVTIDGEFSPSIDTTSFYKLIEKIPAEVKNATLEQALFILNGGGERAKLQSEGVQSYSIGDLSETFNGAGVGNGLPISNEARGYLSKLISRIGVIE